MRLPLWLKIVCTACIAVWIPVYWRQYGAQNFLYVCDLGNLLILAGLWTESRLIFSWQASGLLVFEMLFDFDLLIAVLTGRHVIGGTEFMFDPHVLLSVRLLSLFHAAAPPLLLWAVARLGYDPRAWKWATIELWLILPANYFWRPQFNINFARGLFLHGRSIVSGPLYFVTCLVAVPILVYRPTHRALQYWVSRRVRVSSGRSQSPTPAA